MESTRARKLKSKQRKKLNSKTDPWKTPRTKAAVKNSDVPRTGIHLRQAQVSGAGSTSNIAGKGNAYVPKG